MVVTDANYGRYSRGFGDVFAQFRGKCGHQSVPVLPRSNSAQTGQFPSNSTLVQRQEWHKPHEPTRQNGRPEIELVGNAPSAIGYGGLGHATADVKILKLSKKKGEPAVLPSIATAQDKSYPMVRPLYMVTPGEPPPKSRSTSIGS